MKQPSVTVLVTVRNSEKTIGKCIDSILKQNYKNYKIYVTDAFSTDNTFKILKKYGKKIQLEQIHGNMSVAYNHMLKKVKSDFVAFTDADAVVDKNWLKLLTEAFEPHAVTVGGTIKNPTGMKKLPDLIGRELEYRFSNLPKYVARLPTMNLCVRTKIAKLERFDENLNVAQETEWGYRLNKYGKTIFTPKAIVWHYHRATWRSYFKQQYTYGLNVPKVYLSKRNRHRISGDEVSNRTMISEMFLMMLSLFFLVLGSKWIIFAGLSSFLFFILFLMFTYETHNLSKTVTDFIYYMMIFSVRTFAWGFGIVMGLLEMMLQ
ncbi:MAG: glycosyltransferase [Nanoarchaeota archaeon]|nr:glycosyltransferase [Nanoarchaeota archaeon]